MQEKRIQIEGQDTDYLVRDDGTIWNEKRKRILNGTIQRNEYHSVQLSFQGKIYYFMVHRLVAEAFCKNPNNYTIVHHKDGNKLNNCANNLMWVSTRENNQVENRRSIQKKRIVQKADLQKNWIPLNVNKNYGINDEGEIINFSTGKLLTGFDRNGYKRVILQDKVYSIHRLVYETFIGPIPDKRYIDHIDGNRSNNNLNNLRLVTQSDNMYAAMKNSHSGQVSVLQFDKQGNFIQEFPNIQAAADSVGVTHAAVRSAIQRNGSSGGFLWKRKE